MTLPFQEFQAANVALNRGKISEVQHIVAISTWAVGETLYGSVNRASYRQVQHIEEVLESDLIHSPGSILLLVCALCSVLIQNQMSSMLTLLTGIAQDKLKSEMSRHFNPC